MYSLLRLLPWQRMLGEQLPALTVAWVIAESFYTWKSFSLEMLGFLATWFVLDAAIQGLRKILQPRH